MNRKSVSRLFRNSSKENCIPQDDDVIFLQEILTNYKTYIKELRDKNARLEAIIPKVLNPEAKVKPGHLSPKSDRYSRSRSPSLCTLGTKKTYKELMGDEFFSDVSQRIPPSLQDDSWEMKYIMLIQSLELGLTQAINYLSRVEFLVSEIPDKSRETIQLHLQLISSALLPLLDLIPNSSTLKKEEIKKEKPENSVSPRERSIPLQISPLRVSTGPVIPKNRPTKESKVKSPRKIQSFLSGNLPRSSSPKTKLTLTKSANNLTSQRKPSPPSREHRPALKDVSVFSSERPSVDVSLGHFKKTKKELRPFAIETEEGKRRHTAYPNSPNSTRSQRVFTRLRRWNSGPNLNSWEMPKDSRSNFAPPVFKPDSSHIRIDVQQMLNRQPRIRKSLKFGSARRRKSLTTPLTFALTDDNYSLLVGGEMNSLFEWILERSRDWIEVESILLLHKNFCPTKEVIRTMTYWYENSTSRSSFVKLQRVAEILERWITLAPKDFLEDENVYQIVTEFLECEKFVDFRTCEGLLKKISELQEPVRARVDTIPPDVSTPQRRIADILCLPAVEIAKHLSNTEFVYFQNIHWDDLMSPKTRESSSNIDVLIKKFTHISLWVATEIVTTAHTKKRGAVIRHFIQLAQACLELRNFAVLSAVVSGLNMNAIQRLKKSWKTLPKNITDQLASLEGYVMPYNNFAKYRQALAGAAMPCLPFIGIYCRDLTHIEEGNPDRLDNGHINLEKLRMKAVIAKEIRMFQSHPYSFAVSGTTQNYLNNISALTEAAIKKLSYQVEPRNEA